MLTMRNSGRNKVKDYADKFGVEFHEGEKPWGCKVDVIMPSAMQNDVKMDSAKKIVENGIKYYIEVANMPTTNEALFFLMGKGLVVAPSKAVNAGGVATSGLEMTQNAEHLSWTAKEVDERLHHIMQSIHEQCVKFGTQPDGTIDYVKGANIAGFMKVAQAMLEQGII